MANEFEGQVAWITGAAGALGAAIATELTGQGAQVVLSGRRAGPLHALADRLASTPSRARPILLPLDIRDDASVRATLARLLEHTGRIDQLVNSTTLPLFGEIEALDDDAWLSVLDTKLIGYVRTLRAVLPHFAAQGRGAVVNISGRGGRQPSAVHLPGGAANAAVNLITKGLADQYRSRGVRINAVAPGPIRSARLDALSGAGGPDASLAGEPADVARAVAFLLSDAARHINGTVLAVDGGSIATV